MVEQRKKALKSRIEEFRLQKLSLDMTRGKPGAEQLDISNPLLTMVDEQSYLTPAGLDTRNYGGLDGFPEAKALFGEYLDVSPQQVIIGGNSSLNMMYDTLAQCMTHGTSGGGKPWFGGRNKFLCPVPGYDRHFSICDHFGIEMIPVALGREGPDMAEVESLVAEDAAIRGMWCVPKYSNPSGVVYSDDTVDRLAAMKTADADFLILWDNAYNVHHLGGGPAALKNIVTACEKAGNPERVLVFGSTSKISLPGAGIAIKAGSEKNMEWSRARLFSQTIGSDKVNILRHLLFFKDMRGILEHMDKHARIISPKFAAVQEILERELGGREIATWSKPEGGYFVSLETPPYCATATVKLAGELGVKLTRAGATWPYGKDPTDSNIRIAPTLPSLQQIRTAVEVLSVCIQWVALEKGVYPL